MLPVPRADLVPNTFDYEITPLVKATGFREYDARWLFGPEINLLGMTTLELESLAPFYDYLYRRPVGRYVIHVCDSVVCWMFHQDSIFDYLCRTLGVPPDAPVQVAEADNGKGKL